MINSNYNMPETIFRAVIDRLDEISWMIDVESGTIFYVNPSFETVWDRPRTHLCEGSLAVPKAVHPADRERICDAVHSRSVEDYDETYRIELADETVRWIRDRTLSLRNEEDSVTRIVQVARDITDQNQKPIEDEYFHHDETVEALITSFPDLAFVIDERGYYRDYLAGPDSESFLYEQPDSFLGKSLHDVLPTDAADHIHAAIRKSLDTDSLQTVEYHLDMPSGTIWFEGRLAPIPESTTDVETDRAVVFVGRDITDRVERERKLAYQRSLLKAQQETSIDGILVVDDDREFVTFNERFVDLWDLPAEITEADDDAALDWVLEQLAHPEEFVQQVEYLYNHPTETSRDELTLKDGRVFDRYSSPVVGEDDTYYGRLWVFRDITEQKNREAKLRRQRDELARLSQVNTVIRAISQTVVHAETRNEIERAVCEQLAATGPYEFAVAGEFSPSYDHFTIRAMSTTQNEKSDTGQRPTITDSSIGESSVAKAAKTRTVTVGQDGTLADRSIWDDIAPDHVFESYAAVPIVHENIVYGVLVIFAAQPASFDDEELAVLEELGETIGHAINALDRKRMLLADEIVEVEYQSLRYAQAFADVDEDVQASIDRVIPLQKNTQALYVTIEGIDPQTIIPELERLPKVTDIRLLNRGEDGGYVELQTTGETIPSVVGEAGGRVREMRLANNEFHIVVELPSGAHVRDITDRLQEVDPTLGFVAQKTVSQREMTPMTLRTTTTERLTARQQTALEMAYYGGYFDWPRESTGEVLAERLGVSAPTFHHHLRHGERKLLELLFDEQPMR